MTTPDPAIVRAIADRVARHLLQQVDEFDIEQAIYADERTRDLNGPAFTALTGVVAEAVEAMVDEVDVLRKELAFIRASAPTTHASGSAGSTTR